MLAVLLPVIVSSRGVARDGLDKRHWPALQPGVWETESTRKLPSGKVQRWKESISQCHDATELLRGYWGLGIVEEAGCRYTASQAIGDQFKITGECPVRHVGVAKTDAIVTTDGPDVFEMHVRVVEGKRVYEASQVGHRRSACSVKPDSR